MTDRQISLIKQSWQIVIIHAQEAGDLFYQKLFEVDPALRSLFKYDVVLQSRKFMAMMTMFVSKTHCLENFVQEMNALGQRHAGYGAQSVDYAKFKKAIWHMLEHTLESRWDLENQEAWENAFETLSQKMIEASELP